MNIKKNNLKTLDLDYILFNNKFLTTIKLSKKKFHKKIIKNYNCDDKIILYIDNKTKKFSKYKIIKGCFISRYSVFLLYSLLETDIINIKNIVKLSKQFNKNKISFDVLLKEIDNLLFLPKKILNIIRNNPYRIRCFLSVWENLNFKIKKKI